MPWAHRSASTSRRSASAFWRDASSSWSRSSLTFVVAFTIFLLSTCVVASSCEYLEDGGTEIARGSHVGRSGEDFHAQSKFSLAREVVKPEAPWDERKEARLASRCSPATARTPSTALVTANIAT